MEHVAIDLGGRESQVCVRSADGSILEEIRCATPELGHYLERRPPSRVIVETCTESFAVADWATKLGHEVRVVPATLVRSLGVGARKTKTDVRDARVLSEVSCRIDLPSVHVPALESRARKTACGMRDALVSSRTQMINTVRAWMRGQGLRCSVGDPPRFVARVKKLVSELPAHVARLLAVLDELTRAIDDADAELARVAKDDATCKRLMSVPGVGPVTAVRFVAAIDDVGRFDDAHKLESYLGLTPGEQSSGDRQRRTSITKAGPTRLRAMLVQAAWAARNTKAKHPMVLWSLEVEKRRGKRAAVIALARKIAGIL